MTVVVVGAGPGGLAAAATMMRAGVPVTVLERSDDVGSAWQSRYDSLHLHTVRWLSGLPGLRIPRQFARWVSRDDYVRYLRMYAARFDIRPEFGVTLERVDRNPDGWILQTSDGTRRAEAVVLATGYSRMPAMPNWSGHSEFTGRVVHSSAYRSPDPRDRQVLVVGAGNSAAEIAAELALSGAQVSLSIRTPPNILRRDVFGFPSQLFGIGLRHVPEFVMNPLSELLRRISVPDLTEFGLPAPSSKSFSKFLQTRTVPILDHGFVDLVSSGRIVVVPTIDHFDGAGVVLSDGVVLYPDAVIAATGYTTGLDPLVGHLGVLDAVGMPKAHGAQTVPGAEGLHFVGITVELSGLLREIGLEARAVGRHLASNRRNGPS